MKHLTSSDLAVSMLGYKLMNGQNIKVYENYCFN